MNLSFIFIHPSDIQSARQSQFSLPAAFFNYDTESIFLRFLIKVNKFPIKYLEYYYIFLLKSGTRSVNH